MSRAIRAFLLWMLVLALPLQGYAATVMLCGQDGMGRDAGTSTHGSIDPSHHGHAMRLSDGGSGFDTADIGISAADEAGNVPAHLGHSGDGIHKCGGAGCSVPLFEASAVFSWHHLRSPTPAHPVPDLYQGVVLDSPDRPPRLLLV